MSGWAFRRLNISRFLMYPCRSRLRGGSSDQFQILHHRSAGRRRRFSAWGFLPVYFNVIGPRVSVWEILIHRVVWAAVLLSIVALVTGRWGRVIRLIRRRRAFLALCGSAALIAGNWGLFIWAVTSHHILEASLGYYINPLLNVLLGFLFLGERFRPLQLVSIAVATAGVLIMIVGYGQVPWVALILAGCFGAYGLIRKQVQVESDIGLLIETLLLLPFALIWLGSMYAEGQAAFLRISPGLDLLLIERGRGNRGAAGPVCLRRPAPAAGHRGPGPVHRAHRAFPGGGYVLRRGIYHGGRHHLRLHLGGAGVVHAGLVVSAGKGGRTVGCIASM